jgi:hypothetical protein
MWSLVAGWISGAIRIPPSEVVKIVSDAYTNLLDCLIVLHY